MKFEEIKTAGVLGGGIMGGGIAQGLAIGGYTVVIRDISDAAIEATRQAVFEGKWGLKRAVELGKLKFDDGAAAIARVSFTTALEGLANCDFIIEAKLFGSAARESAPGTARLAPAAVPAARAAAVGFKNGQRVKHPQFGRGIVSDISGAGDTMKVTVRFDDGRVAKLLTRYAPLEPA